MGIGRLIIRLVVGGLFVGHGLQKLRGDFGGPGIDGTEQMMANSEMYPPRANAYAIALTETVGGAAIAAGAATPAAAGALIAAMVTAIRKVHAKNGVWNTKGGFEYNLVLIAALTGITADGPGALSLDAVAGRRRWGPVWGAVALLGGIAASAAAVGSGRVAAERALADEAERAANRAG